MTFPLARIIPSVFRRFRSAAGQPYITVRFLLLLAVVVAVGLAITEENCRRRKHSLLDRHQSGLDTIARDLRALSEKSLQVARSFGGSPRSFEALALPTGKNIAAANELLDRYNDSFGMSICYLMDLRGTALASSNRNAPDSLVGKTFDFRPYVRRALDGESCLYFAYGAVSHLPGLFAAEPVRDAAGTVRGVAAVKNNLEWLRDRIRAEENCFLVDPNGIIFFASSANDNRRTLWPLDPAIREQLTGTRQFDGEPGPPLFKSRPPDDGIVSFRGKSSYFVRHDIGMQGWSLYSLVSTAPVRNQRFLGWLATGLTCLLTVLLAMVRRQASVIAAARAHYASLLDSAVGIAIFATDSRGTITVFNPGAEKMLDYTPAETVGKMTPLQFHVPGELGEYGDQLSLELGDRIGGFELLTARVRTRRSDSREWTYVKKDGTRITVNLLIARQDFSGRDSAQFLFVATDITQRKKFEEALLKANNDLLKNEAALQTTIASLKKAHEEIQETQHRLLQSEKFASIGHLSAGLAHGIEEPIGFFRDNCRGVQARLDALGRYVAETERLSRKAAADGPAGETGRQVRELFDRHRPLDLVRTGRELLRASLEGTQRIQKIVRDLRTFSDGDDEARAAADVSEIVANVLNMISGELRLKAELVTDYRSCRKIECNAQQLGRVFVNILMNAIQAIPDKGVITVSTYDADDDDAVCVEINDTGTGMPPEIVDRIFDPFFTTKSPGRGTGLGLSVSLDIIRKHDGAIDVASEPGSGTTFTIRFPAA